VVAQAAHDRLKERIPAPALRFVSTRARHYMPAMIRIAITPVAFDAIAATLHKLRHLCGPAKAIATSS
jgi:hypothetical protein